LAKEENIRFQKGGKGGFARNPKMVQEALLSGFGDQLWKGKKKKKKNPPKPPPPKRAGKVERSWMSMS